MFHWILLGSILRASSSDRKDAVSGVLKHGAACIDDRGCSMNGQCNQGSCNCTPAWTGPACNKLAFVPGPRESGYRQINVRLPSPYTVLRDHASPIRLSERATEQATARERDIERERDRESIQAKLTFEMVALPPLFSRDQVAIVHLGVVVDGMTREIKCGICGLRKWQTHAVRREELQLVGDVWWLLVRLEPSSVPLLARQWIKSRSCGG